MNTTDFESQITKAEAQETANDSSSTPYTVAPINCQATTDPKASVGNIENDCPPNSITSSSGSNKELKIFAPVIPHDVTLPNTAKKVPMVMVPVPDSRTLMAIPISTLSQITEPHMDASKNQQQEARDLLVWNEGVGTLRGCDLRFKINQLGNLEYFDSDDESENQIITTKLNAISKISNQSSNMSINNNNNCKTTNGVSTTTTTASTHLSSSYSSTSSLTTKATQESIPTTNDRSQKRAKLEIEPVPIRQISPGSSLLRDGPNTRPRPKSSLGSSYSSNSLSLLKKLEQNQNAILLEKLVPKQRLDEIKTTNVGQWTIEDVKNFIDSIPGCSGYGELFESQQICGKSLMYLDQRDLLDVINVKLGPAVKIYHAISLLK